MNSTRTIRTLAVGAGLLVVLAPVIGCSHVKKQDLNTRLTQLESDLRDDYEAGDRALAGRIDSTDARVRTLGSSVADLDARTVALESDLRALAVELDATVERFGNALAFNVPVHFDYDQADVRPQDEPLLDRFAGVVGQYYPDSLITVEGFTDPAGPAEYNLKLGQRRADSVRSYLVDSGGLHPSRVRAVSYGEAVDRQVLPGAEGPGEQGEPNRRVTLVVETADADWDLGEVTVPAESDELDNTAPDGVDDAVQEPVSTGGESEGLTVEGEQGRDALK